VRALSVAWGVVGLLVGGPVLDAHEQSPDVARMQGRWEVVELVEDGKVIPKEAIKEWLPSGGKLEIADNAIIFQSPADGKRHVKLFSIDATQSPKGLEIVTKEGKDAWGILRIDEKQVVICLSDADAPRPTEFSAKEGSERLLMTLERVSVPTPAAEPAPQRPTQGVTAKPLTDADVQALLKGTWRQMDDIGALYGHIHRRWPLSDGAWNE